MALSTPTCGPRFWEEKNSFTNSQYSFNNPHNPEGKPKLYVEILNYLASNGPSKKGAILEALGKKPGSFGDLFSAMSTTGLLTFEKGPNIWAIGPHYHTWAYQFLGPNSVEGRKRMATKEEDAFKNEVEKIKKILAEAQPASHVKMEVILTRSKKQGEQLTREAVKLLREQNFESMAESLQESVHNHAVSTAIEGISKFIRIDLSVSRSPKNIKRRRKQ